MNLVTDGDPVPQREIRLIRGTNPEFFDSNNADKNIGLYIKFDSRIGIVSGQQYPISLDFSSFRPDGTPINHIIRQSAELTPAQETTHQNLGNAMNARNLAITQQQFIVDYWTNSNNPFANDRELAQARIDYANAHITQTIEQHNSYQQQLNQILNP